MADTTLGPYSPERELDAEIVVTPTVAGTPEFKATTEVIYVNGIGNDLKASTATAQRLADITHDPVRLLHVATNGFVSDVVRTAEEKLGRHTDKPEAAVTSEVLKHLNGHEFAGDVHFYAHSRGALVVQRGLEQVERDLGKEHFTAAEIADVMSHVTVETAGGASLGMPKGVRAVNYVDPHDSVATLLGVGKPSLKDVAVLDAAAGSTSLVNPAFGIGSTVGIDAYLLAKPLLTHPNGPVVDVPPIAAKPGSGPLGNLLANHAVDHYLDNRRPFEATYATDVHGRHADAVIATDPKVVAGRQAEAAVNERLAESPHAPQLAPDLRSAIDRLAATGGPKLPAAASIVPDEHRDQRGSFVQIDDRTVALHTGRGAYEVFDVQRDLHDRMPPLGRAVDVSAQGVVREPPVQTLERSQ
jgi:hypothetical protein